MTPYGIVATGIAKHYRVGNRSITALATTDVTITSGEFLVVTGPSRSGKTTLVNLLAGWEVPDEGTIYYPAAETARPEWAHIAVIPQALALLPELTVGENITLPARAARDASSTPLNELLLRLDVLALCDRGIDEISVGERQRVMVARALLCAPAVILADEPAAHQDEGHATAICDVLADAVAGGAACVYATRHDPPRVAAARIHQLQPLSSRHVAR